MIIKVSLKKYPLPVIKYAACAMSAKARVLVRLEPRSAAVFLEAGRNPAAEFRKELEAGRVRWELMSSGRGIRGRIMLAALAEKSDE